MRLKTIGSSAIWDAHLDHCRSPQMATALQTLFPDPDLLLDLAPEELAGVLLSVAANQMQCKTVNFVQISEQVYARPGDVDIWPRTKFDDILMALAEAWHWLTVQGLLNPEPGGNGASGHMRFSRRAKQILRDNSFPTFSASVAFPKALLHPKIANEVWIDLARGDYATAIFRAMKEVEVTVRDRAGYRVGAYGVEMVRKAFAPSGGPLTDMSVPESEREGLAHLFAGAIGSYKNPHSHRQVEVGSAQEAQEIVILASHLLRIVESRPAA